jgi:ATP/maltotriose-dependent transcriptional regulator MalT
MLGRDTTMAQPAEQLVGRAAELGSLEDTLNGLSRGRAVALALVGEPGIGKTRLLAELAARAETGRRLVLSGSASELERELPFGIFVDALDEYVEGLEPRRLAALDDATRAELAHVFPSLDGSAAGDGAGLQHERYRTHRAVRRLLEALAQERPLVLVLDDLHWADSGSIELLGGLLRRPPSAPVLVALAVRPRQVPERLSAPLERAHASGFLTRIEVGSLDAEDARRLLGDAVSGSVAAALYEESGGNPFYLQELARALARRLEALPGAGAVSLAGVEVPRMVAAALADELALLSGDARRVLEGAAVAGDPFEPELAAAAAAMPEQATVDGLDQLLALDLVRATDVPRRFRFRHPLVRQAVYEAAPGGWRIGAHERCAAALADRGAAAPARANHVEHAARHGDQAAIAVLQEAGEATAQRTPAGAARWFGAALRLLPAAAPAEQRLGLLSARAGALAATGEFPEAHAALVESLRIAPREELALRVRLTGACAGIEHILGRHDAARARLVAALDDMPDPGSREAAALMIDLGVGAFYRMENDEARAWADRALAVARPLGDAPLEAAAGALAALALAIAGSSKEAGDYRARAAASVDAMDDDELAVRLDAIANLAGAEGYLEGFAESLAHAERGIAVARATGQGELFPVLIPAVNAALFGLGRFAESAELLDGAIEGARLMGNAQPLAWNLLSSAAARMMCGDLDAALAAATESVELSRGLGVSLVSSYAEAILGLVLIERGDPESGVERLVGTVGGASLPESPGNWRAWDLERLAQGWLALGRHADADRAAADAESFAAATGLRFAAALAGRARARVALAAGDAAGAAEHALASVAAAEEVGAVAEAALSRTLAGRALAAAGEPDRAAELLEQAAAALEACGALRYRDEAERELGKLGRRRHRRTRPGRADGSGVDTLTERELQIARLIVDRRTNPQIAADLFLSQKTVETHVRNLFRKLDVSSRVDVARVVERADREARL